MTNETGHSDMHKKTAILFAILVTTITMIMSYQRQQASGSFFDDLAKIFNPKPSVMEGFSLYQNSIHKASIQYPSVWDKHEIFNNDYVAVVEFIIPSALPLPQNTSDVGAMKQYSRGISNPPDSVIFTVKNLPVETISSLENVTDDQIKTLGFRFDNFSLLSTSYDIKMGDIPASKAIYTYKDSGIQKKGMQVNSVEGHREITLDYKSIPQDFDHFLPTIYRMIGSFQKTS